MRILNSTTLHGWSAGSWYAVAMMAGLQRRGHEVMWLVPEGRTAERVRREGMRVVEGPDLRTARPWNLRRATTALGGLVEREKPDVVIAHWGPDHTWWGIAAGGQAGPPVLRMRAHDPRPPAIHPLARWLQRERTSGYVVANERQRRAYVGRAGIAPERVHRIPPGFDVAAWNALDRVSPEVRLDLPGDGLTVASVARFAPQKDHESFFEAAARVASASGDIRFLVVGYEAEFREARIRAMAARYPVLRDRLAIWSRRLPEGRSLVSRADIGVVHSRASEAISRVAFEYMSDGIPIVATRVGGLPEVIREWETGLLVPAGDPGALAGAILKLLRSERLRSRLAEGGRRRLEADFDPERGIGRLESVLQRHAETRA